MIASQVLFGDSGFGVSTPNVISDNGASVPGSSGIFMTLGSLATINPRTPIQNSTGNGITPAGNTR
ncbi:MAG: hypothetical protein ACJ8J7_16270 [Sulfurifustaceae bacterium]